MACAGKDEPATAAPASSSSKPTVKRRDLSRVPQHVEVQVQRPQYARKVGRKPAKRPAGQAKLW
jgi:hypothetical protein